MGDSATPVALQQSIAISETTWLEGIREIDSRDMPGGQGKILMIVLHNGHRYAIPLQGSSLRATQIAISPVVLPNASGNGHGA